MRGSANNRGVSYAKWGYIFIAPFFIAFFIFQLIPLVSTIYYSFFEYYRSGLKIVGPNPVGIENYKALFDSDFLKYMGNTIILWIAGFIPQIVISLLLAAWFTDLRLKIYGKQFFKVVIYMPNLIMASAFAMLFFALFSDNGPVNGFLMSAGIIDKPFRFLSSVVGTRGLVALMNFLMWFGNTTILLMAAVMGINPALFEAAELDGCTHLQIFFKITLPMIRPILVYVLITSMIGGLQMWDLPYLYKEGTAWNKNTETIAVFIYNKFHIIPQNYGYSAAASVILFVITSILGCICFAMNVAKDAKKKKALAKEQKKLAKLQSKSSFGGF